MVSVFFVRDSYGVKAEPLKKREIKPIKSTTIIVGDAIKVGPDWFENTTVAFGPGEHPAAPEGRLLFASRAKVVSTKLNGDHIQAWYASLNESFPPKPIPDNHIVKLKGGDVLHTFEGTTWHDYGKKGPGWSQSSNVLHTKPDWWEVTKEWAAKGNNQPGARGKIWVFRSSDAGATWIQLPGIDALTLQVPDPTQPTDLVEGLFAPPRNLRCQDKDGAKTDCDKKGAKKVASIGGPDGHFTYADPYSDRIFISTPWYYGVGEDYRVQDRRGSKSHLVFVSKDKGTSWKIIGRRDDVDEWRGPVSSLPSGKVAVSHSKGSNVLLSLFNRDDQWVDLGGASVVTTLPGSNRSKDALFGRIWGYRSLSRDLDGKGFKVSTAYWEQNLVHRLYFIPTLGSGSQSISTTIRALNSPADTLQGTFIEGLPNDDISVFYWFERIPDNIAGEKYIARFQVYQGRAELLQQPGTLSIRKGKPYSWDYTGRDPGDYMDGAVYRSHKVKAVASGASKPLTRRKESVRHFVATWIEDRTLMFNTITVMLMGKGRNILAPQIREPDPRPRKIVPILKPTGQPKTGEDLPVHLR